MLLRNNANRKNTLRNKMPMREIPGKTHHNINPLKSIILVSGSILVKNVRIRLATG